MKNADHLDQGKQDVDYELRLSRLEEAIAQIVDRNRRVENDKAWETSFARKGIVAALTYIITACVFLALGVTRPLSNALIPLAGYAISTLTLPAIKQWWVARRRI